MESPERQVAEVRACDDGSNLGGWAGFDGDNVIRLFASYPTWRSIHGPGIDDPLVAQEFNGASYTRHYYLTDGGGRHLAFTDSIGNNQGGDLSYTQNGGNQAGSIDKSHTFANSRAESPTAPQLSFYRNRYYDQQTGRFTQEDPIGIAGGINLYKCAGNSPTAATDPFGLKVCIRGTRAQRDSLKGALEEATNTIITLDTRGCVVNWQARGRSGFERIQAEFGQMVLASDTFRVRFADADEEKERVSHFDLFAREAVLRRGDIGWPYPVGYGQYCPVGSYGNYTLAAAIVHELLGHGGGLLHGTRPRLDGIGFENIYHRAVSEPGRCSLTAQ